MSLSRCSTPPGGSLIAGKLGLEPVLGEDVLPALLRRTPVSVELALYAIIVIIPLGLLSGVSAGAKKDSRRDFRFRLAAFIGISIPSFVLALMLMSVFMSRCTGSPRKTGFPEQPAGNL